jgi:hypothetical protein
MAVFHVACDLWQYPSLQPSLKNRVTKKVIGISAILLRINYWLLIIINPFLQSITAYINDAKIVYTRSPTSSPINPPIKTRIRDKEKSCKHLLAKVYSYIIMFNKLIIL